MEIVRHADGTFHWEGVEVRKYKDEGAAPFRDVTRQVLFESEDLPAQLRYFEVAAGGWTTLERHRHVHAVMVIRGEGKALVGDQAYTIKMHDLVSVPPMTWHQFHASPQEPLGFLCLVASDRDRPQLPAENDIARLSEPLKR